MADFYGGEFTPEITGEFLKRLQSQYRQNADIGIGKARSSALSRGLSGDPYEALATGAVEGESQRGLSDQYANLAMKVAGMNQGERMTKQGQRYNTSERIGSQDYASKEAELSRQNQLKLAKMQYDFQQGMYEDMQPSWLESLGSAGLNALSQGAGTALGKRWGG